MYIESFNRIVTLGLKVTMKRDTKTHLKAYVFACVCVRMYVCIMTCVLFDTHEHATIYDVFKRFQRQKWRQVYQQIL